jgi:hypothetical protein
MKAENEVYPGRPGLRRRDPYRGAKAKESALYGDWAGKSDVYPVQNSYKRVELGINREMTPSSQFDFIRSGSRFAGFTSLCRPNRRTKRIFFCFSSLS